MYSYQNFGMTDYTKTFDWLNQPMFSEIYTANLACNKGDPSVFKYMYQGAKPYCLLSNPTEMKKGKCLTRKCTKMSKKKGCRKYNIDIKTSERYKQGKGVNREIKQ